MHVLTWLRLKTSANAMRKNRRTNAKLAKAKAKAKVPPPPPEGPRKKQRAARLFEDEQALHDDKAVLVNDTQEKFFDDSQHKTVALGTGNAGWRLAQSRNSPGRACTIMLSSLVWTF
ncbi:unnamed protein product [Symbiodinium sp. KB8]|nr:unnamed protein product [Symbiodinium sp. KB8]